MRFKHPLIVLGIGFVILSFVFVLVWAVQLRTQNAGMVDPVWSWSLGFLGVLYGVLGTGETTSRVLVALLAGSWGLRLGGHLWLRNYGKPEDGRYRRFREQWGASANRNMFWFFQFQVVLAVLLSLGFIVVAYRTSAPPLWATGAAILVWAASVVGEALADWQLERFKKDPQNRGKVCRAGLWRYSRHPNYFFECLHWPTYILLGIGSPWVALTLVPPAVMWFLLLKVSGIPLTEQQTAKTRPEYADYIRTTSAFIPWPPKAVRPQP
jgi:steroid 5-alpha reductase family enzyme